jgi:hypothetical protein
MGFLNFLKIGRGSASRRVFRPSPLKLPMFTRRKRKPTLKKVGCSQEPSIFNKTGYTKKKKLQENIFKAHTEVHKLKPLAARKKESKIFQEYFPEQKRSFFSKKEVQKKIRDMEKSKMYKPTHERKKIRKQIESLKKASGL